MLLKGAKLCLQSRKKKFLACFVRNACICSPFIALLQINKTLPLCCQDCIHAFSAHFLRDGPCVHKTAKDTQHALKDKFVYVYYIHIYMCIIPVWDSHHLYTTKCPHIFQFILRSLKPGTPHQHSNACRHSTLCSILSHQWQVTIVFCWITESKLQVTKTKVMSRKVSGTNDLFLQKTHFCTYLVSSSQ